MKRQKKHGTNGKRVFGVFDRARYQSVKDIIISTKNKNLIFLKSKCSGGVLGRNYTFSIRNINLQRSCQNKNSMESAKKAWNVTKKAWNVTKKAWNAGKMGSILGMIFFYFQVLSIRERDDLLLFCWGIPPTPPRGFARWGPAAPKPPATLYSSLTIYPMRP